MHEVIRRMPWRDAYVQDADPELFLTREWLLTNGLGGYASGTISGILTRRYHGLLIASLPAPLGRIVMLSQIAEVLRFPDGEVVQINGGKGMESAKELPAAKYLTAFRLEHGLPIWSYEVKGIRLEKRALMVHMQNTIHVTYDALSGPGPVRLELRPLI
jgi:predicted glycogen debranching enzyme